MAVLSYKENTLLALQHKEPEFLPMITDVQTYTPLGMDFVCEYTNVPGVAKDWFGQSWTYEPKIKAANPTPGIHLVPDITVWKDYMKFPDLSRLDWEGHAAADTKDWDRVHKLTRINDVFGPWERMFSVMDFQEALCALIEEPEACYDFSELWRIIKYGCMSISSNTINLIFYVCTMTMGTEKECLCPRTPGAYC